MEPANQQKKLLETDGLTEPRSFPALVLRGDRSILQCYELSQIMALPKTCLKNRVEIS
jgi:hypothetical protein